MCASQYNLNKTSAGVKRRTSQRFQKQVLAEKQSRTQKKQARSRKQAVTSKMATATQEQWKENLNMHMMCRDCKEYPPNLVEEFSSGDMVCGSCGLVLGDRIVDTRSEWRTFSNDDQGSDDPSRVGDGANPLLNGSQLQTTIAFSDSPNGRSRDLHRAQNKSTHDKSTKTLLAAYKELGALGDSMHIQSNISSYAKHLFKQVHDAGVFRGKSQETIIAGCLFIACRQMKVPRTFREIFAVTKVSKAEIGRIFKVLEKFFAQENIDRQAKLETVGGKFILLGRSMMFYLTDMTCNKAQCLMATTKSHSPQIQRRSAIAIVLSWAFHITSLTSLKRLP